MSLEEAQNAEAGPSKTRPGWHTVTMRVPFISPQHATIAKRALDVDREPNADFVERSISIDESNIIVDFQTTTVRLLRLATNSFLSSLDLVLRTMAEFAPDPDVPRISDEELERVRQEKNRGETKGIELRGDGKGAGGGEEVR